MVSIAKIRSDRQVVLGQSRAVRRFLFSLYFCVFCLLSVSADAADITTPGEYLLFGGKQIIEVSVSYTDDDNADNSLRIEWVEGTGNLDDPLGSIKLEHAASPYLYTISGLLNQTAYKLRITFFDGDIAGPISDFAGIKPFNPLVHSSLATASSKWSGGWGVKGGQYGEFTCLTCHQKGSGNAKQVKAELAVTDSACDDKLPIELGAGAVVLDALASGSANLGDDSRASATISSNICEACHSKTNYHRYDTTEQPGGTDHYNESDCIKCHSHRKGFTAGCDGCHANPPAWNSHPAHLNEGRMLAALTCPTCHQTASHLSGSSEISFNPAETRLAGATYVDADQTSRYTEAGGYVEAPAYVGCQSVYCHSNGAPFDGSLAYRDPIWSGAEMTCSSCHSHAGDASTLSSNHPKHVGSFYAFDCSQCHATTVSDGSTVSDNSLHLNEQKDVSFASGDYTPGTRACDNLYCHSDGSGNAPNRNVTWADSTATSCVDCHGDLVDPDPDLVPDIFKMTSGAHDVLVSTKWIREYPCEYCHYDSADNAGAIKGGGYHVNEQVDIVIDPQWKVAGSPDPSYDSDNKNCLNLYCHSDGTTVDPVVADLNWATDASHCDSCHGHQGACIDCHDGSDGGEVITAWPLGKEWMNSTPMYANSGAGTSNANSHVRHLQTNFSCDNCHFITMKSDDGTCVTCHIEGEAPIGAMDENGHIDPANHVNKVKDVVFKDGGTYDPMTKTCSDTSCHSGADEDPVWGGTVKCLACHGTNGPDVDDFDAFNGTQARMNLTEWTTSGHGRPTVAGDYPSSGNPPANFPADNPCWHCHDRSVVHEDPANPYRLQVHAQFEKRFEKECLYCHMEGTDAECLGCHDEVGSLSAQIDDITTPVNHVGMTTCTASCHLDDASIHNTESGSWTVEQKADIKNQYVMMGVCLQCHDNDDNDRCHSCHEWGGEPADDPYKIGFDPGGIGFITGASKASSGHFGHKHWQAYLDTGTWKGGKFCWDCHDPHGDSNIYMIQAKVAIETEGQFGTPVSRADVVFTKTTSGVDYAKSNAPYNGICNICHTDVDHFLDNYGDGHRASRRCTDCHEHGFGGGHASGGDCNSCHNNKPIPNHLGFGLPRDCIKCHDGAILLRMDILRQFNGQSHHVQGVPLTNKHCYECHWETTPEGLIDNTYHEGYNYKTYATVPNAPSDLVVYGTETRPTSYQLGVTAVTFDATKIGTAEERTEVAKVTEHCLSCHSDQNNDFDPFGDCKTPRQYAWDRQSIAARYSQYAPADVTTWGKYSGTNTADKDIQKAFSAHGNAVANQGGWSNSTGEDGSLINTRAGTQNVQCFDCHSSHGSYTSGETSSYQTFDGSYGGGNLKETQAGKGGYGVTYRAVGVTEGVNPMSAAAAQCFDCHLTETAGSKPWGYNSTFGATEPILGYRDSARFGDGERGTQVRFPFKAGRAGLGGHLKATSPLTNTALVPINGSCARCHDPHGVSPTLRDNQEYAVPLLKGTWLSSPYKEDAPQGAVSKSTSSQVYLDRKTFGTVDGSNRGIPNQINETADQFAGLCLRCHPKGNLTDGTNKNSAFKSLDRVHETVKGWGNNAEHSYSCSKCHHPHVSGLPRLMRTDCLDWNHRGTVETGGPSPGRHSTVESYPRLRNIWPACHETETGAWNNQQWNEVTPW